MRPATLRRVSLRSFNVHAVAVVGRPDLRYLPVRGNAPALKVATRLEAHIDGRWQRVRLVEPPADGASSLLWLALGD